MNRKYLFAGLVSFAALPCFGEVPMEISLLMKDGEFAKADSVIGKSGVSLTAVEADSLRAIMSRIERDFCYTFEEGVEKIQERFPHVSVANVKDWETRNFVETKMINGEKRMFRKAISNIDRLVPELSAGRKTQAIFDAVSGAEMVSGVLKGISRETGYDGGHRITIKYTIDVDADSVPAGEKIRVWMPFPTTTERQKNVTLISSSDKVRFSNSEKHNTVYMERKAKKGQPAHFEIVYSYDVYSKYFSQDYMLSHLKPYDKTSDVYLKYTKMI